MQQIFAPWMATIIALISLFTTTAFALDVNEKLESHVIRFMPGNIIVLNRGMEDGVFQGTHSKLVASEGYVGRAVCIKAGLVTSYWKLYRIIRPELVSKDLTYTLVGMDASEAPSDVEQLRDQDVSGYFPDVDPKEIPVMRTTQDQQAITADLPEDLSQDEAVINSKKSDTQKFIERNLDKEQFDRDFSGMRGNVFVAPFSKQKSYTETETVRYGFFLSNGGKKYELSLNFEKNSMKSKDVASGAQTISDSTNATLNFDVNRITPQWTYFAFVNYQRARYGELYTPKQYLNGSIIGFKRHFDTGKTVIKHDVSYSPTIDRRINEVFVYQNNVATKAEQKISGLRHSVRWRLQLQLSDDVSANNVLWYRPFMDMASWDVDFSNIYLQEDFTLSYRISENIFFDYYFQYTDDIVQKRFNNLPRFTTTNSLNLRYEFSL